MVRRGASAAEDAITGAVLAMSARTRVLVYRINGVADLYAMWRVPAAARKSTAITALPASLVPGPIGVFMNRCVALMVVLALGGCGVESAHERAPAADA